MSLENFYDFSCPYCGGGNTLSIDVTGGSRQSFVVDCETCCAPIAVNLRLAGDEIASIDIRKENG